MTQYMALTTLATSTGRRRSRPRTWSSTSGQLQAAIAYQHNRAAMYADTD